MSGDARYFVAVAGEDHAHRVLATRLCDLALIERGASCGWPDKDELDQARVYGDIHRAESPGAFSCTTNLSEDIARSAPSPLFRLRRIGDEPAGGATLFLQLYGLVLQQRHPPDALLALSDSQNDASKLYDGERAATYIRERLTDPLPVAFGVAHADAEAWFVAGLDLAVVESRQLAAKDEISFDPLQEPHRLTAQPNDAIRDAKRVLRFLIGEGGETVERTKTGALRSTEYEALADKWAVSDLARLGSMSQTGLAAFIGALRAQIAPKVIPGAP